MVEREFFTQKWLEVVNKIIDWAEFLSRSLEPSEHHLLLYYDKTYPNFGKEYYLIQAEKLLNNFSINELVENNWNLLSSSRHTSLLLLDRMVVPIESSIAWIISKLYREMKHLFSNLVEEKISKNTVTAFFCEALFNNKVREPEIFEKALVKAVNDFDLIDAWLIREWEFAQKIGEIAEKILPKEELYIYFTRYPQLILCGSKENKQEIISVLLERESLSSDDREELNRIKDNSVYLEVDGCLEDIDPIFLADMVKARFAPESQIDSYELVNTITNLFMKIFNIRV